MRVPYGWLGELAPTGLAAEIVADKLTMAGFEVEETTEVAGELVLDTHVNANRGDALSMVGIAREVGALTGVSVVHPAFTLCENGPDVHTLAKVIVEAPDLCPRYAARVILGVKIGPSPEWVQQRLTAAGVRPINNVVDVTNYVMLELGQPLHAFDLHQVAEQTIIVRRAAAGEPFTTLDGTARTLNENNLVIADAARPVALAGIMGGENSEVTEATTDILLESTHFERTSIRKTARAMGLQTESSYRFERIVDISGVIRAADCAAYLLAQWAGGTVAKGVIDVFAAQPEPRVIIMRPARINKVLGTDISAARMIEVLRGLELGVVEAGDVLHVTVPTFRADLLEEQDLVEEIARIHGYEHIPSTVPGNIKVSGRLAPEMAFETKVRDLLTAAGMCEGLSYSLIDYRLFDLMLLPEDAVERTQIVPLRNPKSEEFTHLRPTMLLTMLEALRNNARRGIEDVQLFEIGRTFRNTMGGMLCDYSERAERKPELPRVASGELLPLETRTAGIALMGRPMSARWGGGDTDIDFFWLKGILEQLLADLHVGEFTFAPAEHPSLHPGRQAIIIIGGRTVGIFGEVHPRVAQNFDLPRRAYLAELNVDELLVIAAPDGATPAALSRFPAMARDIAFLVRVDQPAVEVGATITAAAGENCESVALFDVYQGKNIPEGLRSLAYRLTFRAAERTLADAEVDAAMATVRTALAERVGAVLR